MKVKYNVIYRKHCNLIELIKKKKNDKKNKD